MNSDIIYARKPGYGNTNPCPEPTREELLEEYREILTDAIDGYVSTYNKINKEDKLDKEVVEDWVAMEFEAIEKEPGKNRMYNILQSIEQKYENESEFLVTKEAIRQELLNIISSYVEEYNTVNEDDKIKKEVIQEWAEMELEDIEQKNNKNVDKMEFMLEAIKEKYQKAIREL